MWYLDRMEQLTGKHAIVTGGSSGIGVEVARVLVAAGASVTIAARREDRLAALATELGAAGGRVAVQRTDMRVEADVVRLVASARERFGGVDVLVNNAGLGRKAPLTASSSDAWREMLEVNVLGLAIATREAVQDMERRGVAGHVVHVSSMAGHRIPGPDSGMYGATKFAVRGLTEGLRQELRAKRSPIRVSCVSPGYVESEFQQVYNNGGPVAPMDFTVLSACDVADVVLWLVTRPPHVQVHDVLLRPTDQRN